METNHGRPASGRPVWPQRKTTRPSFPPEYLKQVFHGRGRGRLCSGIGTSIIAPVYADNSATKRDWNDTLLALTLTILLVSLLFGQALLVLGLTRRLRRPPPSPLPDADCPRAAVVLCLRGADPFLPTCLDGLFAQDHPDFLVRIVIDHADDPAMPMVRECLARNGIGQDDLVENGIAKQGIAKQGTAKNGDAKNGDAKKGDAKKGDGTQHARRVHVSALDEVRDDCSRKCAALVQAIASLPEEIEVVALLDADVVPHPSWLRELCQALQPPDVGAATGNRWYQPSCPNVAALVRYQWNAAAIVQMYWYHIAWGGTLALKRSAIRAAGLLDKWRQAFCEDTMTHGALRDVGLRVEFVPSLMMVNRESCTLRGCLSWVRRQLFVARLYHAAWWLVVAHGLGTGVAIVATIAVFFESMFVAWRSSSSVSADPASGSIAASDSFAAALLLGTTLIGYFGGLLLLLVALETSVRKIMKWRGEPTGWLGVGNLAKLVFATGITQAIYPLVLISAMMLRHVTWRGLDYDVAGPWRIRLTRYAPFGAGSGPAHDQHSL